MSPKNVNARMVIGVDIALNKTGLCVMNSKGRVLKTKVVSPSRKFTYYEKLDYLYEIFLELFNDVLKSHKNKEITLAMEGRLRAGWGGNTLAALEGARVTAYHAYKEACQTNEVEVIVEMHDPNELKHQFAGKRNANKGDMKDAALKYTSFKNIEYQEDIYDAIFLALRSLYGPDFKQS